jgi:hypothetical protein
MRTTQAAGQRAGAGLDGCWETGKRSGAVSDLPPDGHSKMVRLQSLTDREQPCRQYRHETNTVGKMLVIALLNQDRNKVPCEHERYRDH